MLPPSVLLLCAAALAQAPQEVAVPAFDPPLRNGEELRAWARAHAPVAVEMPWLQRPWHLDLANGVEQAWRESKPLALWLGDGHPFGAASAADLALKPAWSEESVRMASRGFVLVADDLHELRAARAKSPALDAWMSRLEAAAPLAAGSVVLAAPDGTPLGRVVTRNAAELQAACARAEAAWTAEHAARFPPPAPPERPGPLPRFARLADAFPHEGLALEIVWRGCDDPAAGPPEWLETPWNRDWEWISADALRVLTVRRSGLGQPIEWPAADARALAELLLADASRGRVAPLAAAEIVRAHFVASPQVVRRGLRSYQLSGEWIAERGGRWESDGDGALAAGRWFPTQPDGVRARARVTGTMEIEIASGRVASLQFGALVQTADAQGVRHHLALARRLDPLEDSARLAPSRAAALIAARDAAPRRGYRALYAEGAPVLDGSLAEPVWLGAPWTEEFGDGARAKWVWNGETLFLAAWSPAPQFAVRVQGVAIAIAADGTVTGADGARAVLHDHGDGWVVEVALPWSALAPDKSAARPGAGSSVPVNVRAGGDDAPWWSAAPAGDGRLLLEPSRAMNFKPSGFR
jgi:hypothetical protein